MSKITRNGGAWKRPVSRMYSYNYQVGENYYHPMTTYLDAKYTDISAKIDTPGALSFSERLAQNWITGRSWGGNVAAAANANAATTTALHSFTSTTASY